MSTKTKISEMPVLSELTSDIIVPASQKSGQTYISGTISLEALENYLKSDLDNHVNNTNQHISDEERNAWNKAVTTLEAFLKDADTSENAVDTLLELQRLMEGDGFDATELLNRITALESIDYATKADIPEMPNLDGYATKGEVGTLQAVQSMLVNTISTWSKTEGEPQSIAGKIKAANDEQNEYIAANYALKTDIPEQQDLSHLVTLEEFNKNKTSMNNQHNSLWNSLNATRDSLAEYALKSDIPAVPSIEGLATEEYVDNAIANVNGGTTDLTGYATEEYVDNAIAGIEIPTVPSLDNYALKSDIPSTAGFLKMDSKNSLSGGASSTVSHSDSLVFGKGLKSVNDGCAVFGRYNNAHNTWNAMLWIGSGTSATATKNQMIVQENQVHYRGELKEASGWIGDFGEYFEWVDGNPNAEDRIGYMVQLNGNMIELAQSFENCIGAISATCIITGGSCSMEWHNRFLRDEWGRELKDENGESIINPEYDKTRSYISRDNRPEWDVVGLLGQVLVRQDGTLKVGGYAGCVNGIATDSDHGYRVLKIVNDNIALVLVK